MLELVALDFETRWGTGYTLRQLSTTEYVRDARFEVHGFSVARQSENFAPHFIRQSQAREYLRALPWDNITLAAHNMNFDGLVLAEHYGLRPARYFCTQAAARYHHKSECRHSLEDLARFHNLAGKIRGGLENTKDKTTAQLSETDWVMLEDYAVRDLKIMLYFALKFRDMPMDEQLLMDLTIRMFTDPPCVIDLPAARAAYDTFIAEKGEALSLFDPKILRSRPKFAHLLELLGVEPPMKRSLKTGKFTFAFAKKDEAFLELLGHPNEAVRDAVEAKLEASSNIDATRAQRIITLGETGPAAICLNFAGALTDRWSGGNKMNIQNVRAGSPLRKALKAPPGHVLVDVDSSQIECRYNGWFCEQEDLLELFRRGEDPYNDMASAIYKRPVERSKPEDKIPGFVGKTARLGLGFQMGGPRFQATLATGKERVHLPLAECYLAVQAYRTKDNKIAAMWPQCQEWLEIMAHGRGRIAYQCLEFDANTKRVWFPNGSSLYYPGLDWDGEQITYLNADHSLRYIYGGKLLENIIQKLARNHVGEVMLEVSKRYRIAWMLHDAIICPVPEAEADEALQFITDAMNTPRSWAPTVPLAAKGTISLHYQ